MVVQQPRLRRGALLALELFRFVRRRLAPYKRIRRLEFSELPKTVSGKIRRVELRQRELARGADAPLGPLEFREEDFPELRDQRNGA